MRSAASASSPVPLWTGCQSQVRQLTCVRGFSRASRPVLKKTPRFPEFRISFCTDAQQARAERTHSQQR